MIKMYKTVNERIRCFNKERGLLRDGFNPEKEAENIIEEVQELLDAKCWQEEVDALCDIIVFATGALYKLDVDPEEAMAETLSEIESRQQDPIQKLKWEDGGIPFGEKWQKHKAQNPSTLYEAQYKKESVI